MSDYSEAIPEPIVTFYNDLTSRYVKLQKENEKLRAVADAVRKYADLYEIEKTNSGKDVIKTLEALDE